MRSGADLHPPRLFGADRDILTIVDGVVAGDLPRPRWTHEAHLAFITGVLLARPTMVPEHDVPGIISRYNVAVGGVNDDTQGYHETLTQFWIRTARRFHRTSQGSLVARANAMIAADPEGRRDYPLQFWSHDRLFSVAARRGWVEPDLGRFGD
jgi:hypothetical protein